MAGALRLLVVPGLHDSGPDHWQSWLQTRYRSSRRVVQRDWAVPDLDAWTQRIADTLAEEPPGPWIGVAHSFGCLALMQHLAAHGAAPFVAALLVAPAEPRRFGVEERLLQRAPLRDVVLIASRTDPWMRIESARSWAQCWDTHFLDLGDVGHVNAASGFGPWPLMRQLVERQIQRWHAGQRLDRAGASELNYAV